MNISVKEKEEVDRRNALLMMQSKKNVCRKDAY